MDLNSINIVTLAYLGDAVYEMYIRNYLIKEGIAKVEELQQEAIKYVSAKSQAKIWDFLVSKNILKEVELEVFKRGRNYKRDTHPKNTDIITYKISTGFESLIGYLYFNDDIKRLEEIINYILEEYDEKNI